MKTSIGSGKSSVDQAAALRWILAVVPGCRGSDGRGNGVKRAVTYNCAERDELGAGAGYPFLVFSLIGRQSGSTFSLGNVGRTRPLATISQAPNRLKFDCAARSERRFAPTSPSGSSSCAGSCSQLHMGHRSKSVVMVILPQHGQVIRSFIFKAASLLYFS